MKYISIETQYYFYEGNFHPNTVPVPIVSSNPVHSEVYSIQHYVIKFVSDLRKSTLVSFTNKTDRQDIHVIVLKVELNATNQPHVFHTIF